MYVSEKNIGYIGFGTVHGFRYPLGFLDCVLRGGLLYNIASML